MLFFISQVPLPFIGKGLGDGCEPPPHIITPPTALAMGGVIRNRENAISSKTSGNERNYADDAAGGGRFDGRAFIVWLLSGCSDDVGDDFCGRSDDGDFRSRSERFVATFSRKNTSGSG